MRFSENFGHVLNEWPPPIIPGATDATPHELALPDVHDDKEGNTFNTFDDFQGDGDLDNYTVKEERMSNSYGLLVYQPIIFS